MKEEEKETGAETAEEAVDFRKCLGIRLVDKREGYVKAEMEVSPSHLNPLGIIHGGCLFSLADTASGMAVMTYGQRVTTVSGNINFLRPGKAEGMMTAVAKVVKHGRTFSICDAEIFDDRDTLVATTTMTFYHLQ